MKKIAIIGAGPFGLIALERLIKFAPSNKEVQILLFDPDGPGGNVWRLNQTNQVIMNTVMQHVTLFAEDHGPNLAEWSQKIAPNYLSSLGLGDVLSERPLDKNDYCQRRYYGLYQRWFFQEIISHLPANIQVQLIKEKVSDLQIDKGSLFIQAKESFQIHQVIIATGHSANQPSEEEIKNHDYAEKHALFYQGPANPSNVPIADLKQDGPIIIRGLGLSFFDYIALFVERWGGKFVETQGKLTYQASGNEVYLVVGSGRGLPYHARPNNQKKPGEEVQPQILTKAFMERFQGNSGELFELLKKEAELVYYQKLLENSTIDLKEFLRDYREKNRTETLQNYRIPKEKWLDWEKLFDPAKQVSPQNFAAFIPKYLATDIAEATLGNRQGAIASAMDAYKELQAPIDFMLDHEKFTPKELFEDFWGVFNRNYSFLTIGAPVLRQKQLLALTEAGLIEFLAPNMVVERKNGSFLAYSKENPERCFTSKNLIEARLPATNLPKTKNPLFIQMKRKGYLSTDSLYFDGKEHSTGALQVKRDTHQVIDAKGNILPDIFCYGIPLEGLDWLNAASPRPHSNDRVFYLAEQIVRTIYQIKK